MRVMQEELGSHLKTLRTDQIAIRERMQRADEKYSLQTQEADARFRAHQDLVYRGREELRATLTGFSAELKEMKVTLMQSVEALQHHGTRLDGLEKWKNEFWILFCMFV